MATPVHSARGPRRSLEEGGCVRRRGVSTVRSPPRAASQAGATARCQAISRQPAFAITSSAVAAVRAARPFRSGGAACFRPRSAVPTSADAAPWRSSVDVRAREHGIRQGRVPCLSPLFYKLSGLASTPREPPAATTRHRALRGYASIDMKQDRRTVNSLHRLARRVDKGSLLAGASCWIQVSSMARPHHTKTQLPSGGPVTMVSTPKPRRVSGRPRHVLVQPHGVAVERDE